MKPETGNIFHKDVYIPEFIREYYPNIIEIVGKNLVSKKTSDKKGTYKKKEKKIIYL